MPEPEVFIQLLCVCCGWKMTVRPSSMAYCENARCESFGKLWRVKVTVEEVEPEMARC